MATTTTMAKSRLTTWAKLEFVKAIAKRALECVDITNVLHKEDHALDERGYPHLDWDLEWIKENIHVITACLNKAKSYTLGYNEQVFLDELELMLEKAQFFLELAVLENDARQVSRETDS